MAWVKYLPDFLILKRNTPQLAATGIKGIRIQLGLGSALPGSIFMRRRLGCPAACCAWVRRRRFTSGSFVFFSLTTLIDRHKHKPKDI
jgi:hypothetical protein